MRAMRAVVVFPEGNGLPVIESLRQRFDPLASEIAAHSTLVFPFTSEISDVDLRAHIEQALEGQRPFRVRFEGVSEVEDEYLFLDAVIGGERLSDLHDRLYEIVRAVHVFRVGEGGAIKGKEIPFNMSAETLSRIGPLSKSIVGTWRLVSRVDRTAGGDRRIEPSLGENPVALLYYDDSGHFAAQFMKRDRATVEHAVPIGANTGGRAVNNSRAQGGYDAYFGTYSVDDARNTVTQHLLGALSPENVGLTLTRELTVEGDTLTISLDTVAADGEPVTRTLSWRRAVPSEW